MAEGAGAQQSYGLPAPPPQTGWERLRELWRRDELQRYPEETVNILKSALTGAVIGWAYGGVPAFRRARRAFIERSHGELFQNRADAVQSAHRAGLRGFLRYGWRWSWRVAAFVAIFNTVSTGLSVYRSKTTIGNFASAGAFTGAVFRMHLGLQGLAGGFVLGTVFGIPAGALLMVMQKFAGETLQERRNRERRELYEQKLVEWQSRLNVTEVLGQTEGDTQGGLETEGGRESRSY
ncbi:complex I assembly factor TIMMDC1, mitochondrial [Falco biarmicus]|uniref:complex I assembly factor TIMMDC1, mitochondrial n=1 Tax=Falco rusticolus TaxID=120794 RepID=UPI0018868C38|nr:complex I assembly factor TIMMDC1, mitochondrial [Falco rusticolus]XP_055557192.1 complex I assembly factor TIMMDC1, mitochondrial [Falco cherrug]XP_056183152.1 complex I assembly factor TIMMDC1, mitochondrial [Falco biarmicus]